MYPHRLIRYASITKLLIFVQLLPDGMADPGPSLLILYASQTGNAQDVAERVEREARRRHYRPRLLPADAYLPHVSQLPTEAAIVFVVSTAGQGEPPDNVAQLWKFLRRKSLAPGSLAGVNVAVFGLGDSGEEQGSGGIAGWCAQAVAGSYPGRATWVG